MLSFAGGAIAAADYDESKPRAQRVRKLKTFVSAPTGNHHQKGEEAEKAVAGLFRTAGFFECPAKYFAFGDPNAVGTVYPHEENGLDGLFIQLAHKGGHKNGKLYVSAIVVNESKFQANGGSPKLGKMGCFTCSGGPSEDDYERTNQMSWRWIHNAVEWAARKGANGCQGHNVRGQCEIVCPLVLDFLADGGVTKVIRTASVVDGAGNLSLYTLSGNDAEQQAGDAVWNRVLQKSGLLDKRDKENTRRTQKKGAPKKKSSAKQTKKRPSTRTQRSEAQNKLYPPERNQLL